MQTVTAHPPMTLMGRINLSSFLRFPTILSEDHRRICSRRTGLKILILNETEPTRHVHESEFEIAEMLFAP
jgi:hypothetical protein